MRIAVEGCCHGALDAIYSHIKTLETKNRYKIDLLLICGDFQAVRNERDLQCMAVPDKYKTIGGFWKYYKGEKTAPVMTILIGGNHEASNYFQELYHGGWIAPKMYYLGHAGCIQVNGMRLAGASGIFKPRDFQRGHWERLPYNQSALKSIYHLREYTVRKLSLLSPGPTIFMSHDWPQTIEQHGSLRSLLKCKPWFKHDIETGQLGSPPMMGLLKTLKPDWWFSAHLHLKYEATVKHSAGVVPPARATVVQGTNPDEIAVEDEDFDQSPAVNAEKRFEQAPARNPDEILLEDEEEDVLAPPPPPPPQSETKFLALDKCIVERGKPLPKRHFLEVMDILTPSDFKPPPDADPSQPVLSFDPEWLAITRAFNPYMSITHNQLPYPDEAQAREAVQRELDWVKKNVCADTQSGGKGIKTIEDCQQFVKTAPAYKEPGADGKQQPSFYPNPQTDAFCSMLEIENKVTQFKDRRTAYDGPRVETSDKDEKSE